ncbi:MAG TPA: LuxR C-terminal-related transcriptional regulator [Pseudonocardia sp.]
MTRQRLLDRLEQAGQGDVVLVSAPAGYGKTALLAEWLGTDPVHTAWVSLSPIDDSDRWFWSILLSSLKGCPAVPADNGLHAVAVPEDPSRDPEFLAAVADALAGLEEPLTIVLDNVQELTSPVAVLGLRSLLRDRPDKLRIVLAGRRDPPLPLGRLRAAGRLVEVRAEHLRFTIDEAAAMLAPTGYGFSTDLVAVLVAETGGWAVGLRLAAPALASAGPTDFVNDLVGTDRAMSDYLVEEVLQTLPRQARRVLDAVSVCDVVLASLAAALSDLPESGDVLDGLERETGLVYRTGPGRFRFVVEPLLRAHLLADLRRRHPETVAQLHVRAARWFSEHDMAAAALDHAVASNSAIVLVEVLHRHGLLLLAAGEHARMRAAAAKLARSVVAADPALALLVAMANLEIGALVAGDRLMAAAVKAWPDVPGAELVALRRVAEARRDALTRERAGAPRLGGEHEAAGQLGLGPMAVLERAFVALAEQRGDTARELASAALAQAGDNDYMVARCLAVLSGVAAAEGDFSTMAALAERADARAPAENWGGTSAAALTAYLRAYRALLLAKPAECLALTDPALTFTDSLGEAAPTVFGAALDALRGAAMTEHGEAAKGLGLLAAARAAADRSLPDLYLALIAVLEHQAAIDLGYVERARDVLDWAVARLPETAEVRLLRARQQFQLGRTVPAGRHLAAVLHGKTAPPLVPWIVVDAWVLACRSALRSGNRGQALRTARRAVYLASQLDVLRPLVQSDEVVELIRELHWPAGAAAFTARVLDARRSRPAGSRVALTESERAVLGMLSTQRSISEIAEALTVSPNTVKTHVRTIYGKLGVHTRREALAVARESGLALPHSEDRGPDFKPVG